MRDQRGFSLLELIVAITAGAVISLVVVYIYAPLDNVIFTVSRRSGMSDATIAVTRMMKEIRRIDDPANISTWSSAQLQFDDVDSNTVNFYISGTNLNRNSDVLARNVQSLTFTYLDKDGNVAGSNNDIRVIKIKLVLTSGVQTIRLQSASRIRKE